MCHARCAELLMASQSSEVFDRAVADTENALQSSFANDGDDDGDGNGPDVDASVAAVVGSDEDDEAGTGAGPVRVAPQIMVSASPPRAGAALTSPLASARSGALISPAGPSQMWRQASEESDLIRPVRPKYGTLDDF